MKKMVTAYLGLALGTPALAGASCFLFPGSPVTGLFLYATPLVMLAMFMWRLSSVNPSRKALHVAAGVLCMVASWFLAAIIIGVVSLAQTGLEGTQ